MSFSSRKQARFHYWWSQFPGASAALVTILYVLQTIFTYIVDDAARQVLHTLVAAALWLLVGVPFFILLVRVIECRSACLRANQWYYVYLFYALQVMLASTSLALHQFDAAAFAGLCPVGTCTTPWSQSLRAMYFACVTFVSVGYGDVSPASSAAIVLTFPHLWIPVFYLGLVLSRITDSPATAVQ